MKNTSTANRRNTVSMGHAELGHDWTDHRITGLIDTAYWEPIRAYYTYCRIIRIDTVRIFLTGWRPKCRYHVTVLCSNCRIQSYTAEFCRIYAYTYIRVYTRMPYITSLVGVWPLEVRPAAIVMRDQTDVPMSILWLDLEQTAQPSLTRERPQDRLVAYVVEAEANARERQVGGRHVGATGPGLASSGERCWRSWICCRCSQI